MAYWHSLYSLFLTPSLLPLIGSIRASEDELGCTVPGNQLKITYFENGMELDC